MGEIFPRLLRISFIAVEMPFAEPKNKAAFFAAFAMGLFTVT
jgi:hypothetical protein